MIYKKLLPLIFIFFLVSSGCISPAFIQEISIRISEEDNYLLLDQTQVYNLNNLVNKNHSYSITISAPELNKKSIRNATVTDSKIVFNEKYFFSINTPEKGDEFEIKIEFLQSINDTEINSYEKVSHVYGKIKIVDNDNIKFTINDSDLLEDRISIINESETQVKIDIETLTIVLGAQVAT
ncbi:MAG: hypothetical protein ACOC40_00835 [Thermoplasmatota archaeon]